MIILKEFIWHVDHDAYHLTLSRNISEIMKTGLIPQIGERSRLIGDTWPGVYFYDSLYSSTERWIYQLFDDKKIETIELLRFNLKFRKWLARDAMNGDFYLVNPVKPDKLSYLRIFDNDNNLIPLSDMDTALYHPNQYNMVWDDLSNYKPFTKTRQ